MCSVPALQVASASTVVPARFADLPTLGRLTGRGNTANVEVVLAARPDFIFDYGSLTVTYRSLADRTQQQPGRIRNLARLYRLARASTACRSTFTPGEV